jgi:RNA 2',3'-cyclic 3'-phosphodiesterase
MRRIRRAERSQDALLIKLIGSAMRIFLAAFADASTQRVLAHRAREFDLPGYRRTPPENFHVTLRFLGDLDAEQLVQLRRSVAGGALGVPQPTPAQAVGIRTFPSRHQARVLGFAIASDGHLEGLATELSRILRADFGDPDRAFQAHVTFARLAPRRRPLQALPSMDVPVAVRFESPGVYESKTLSDGAVYERLFALA